MPSLSENDWLDILDDIQDQRTVLLLGPDIIRIDGKPLNKYMRDTLREQNSEDIAYYYQRDGLFLFGSPEGKVRVARKVKRFYRTIYPNEEVLKRIVQIPFHLILSVNPDTFLSEAFYRYGVKHRFYYFKFRNRDNENAEIDKPTKFIPLIYNLFGSKDQDDSLILDYDDVYKMLQSTLGASSLPNKLLRNFKKARTYIFLGFQFDKWYSQLLLKFLSENSSIEKRISMSDPLVDPDINGFIMNEFQVRFMGDQFDFLGELHERCEKANVMRSINSHANSEEAVDILKCIGLGEIDRALGLLNTVAKGKDWENEVIHTQARYSMVQNRKDKMDSRDYRTEIAQILDAIIELTQKVGA
ncbi:MAG: hypothetical protein DHS20C18_38130 [Saprospiraceae bacterium]|nr:MAG: hypothetical protein DHS20C18_38130 [Saprospiraceae bacterium]